MSKKNKEIAHPSETKKEEFYFTPNGFMVFTEAYHLKRGYCCKSACRHCPYDYIKK
ncbi:hypothetical protein SAMN06298216_1134 [Spirosomataceae bacterium TFI 002]|nr:hypothetical protein SAMN06298216_1134 [Spirosomataceae bacterium TFI 002]